MADESSVEKLIGLTNPSIALNNLTISINTEKENREKVRKELLAKTDQLNKEVEQQDNNSVAEYINDLKQHATDATVCATIKPSIVELTPSTVVSDMREAASDAVTTPVSDVQAAISEATNLTSSATEGPASAATSTESPSTENSESSAAIVFRGAGCGGRSSRGKTPNPIVSADTVRKEATKSASCAADRCNGINTPKPAADEKTFNIAVEASGNMLENYLGVSINKTTEGLSVSKLSTITKENIHDAADVLLGKEYCHESRSGVSLEATIGALTFSIGNKCADNGNIFGLKTCLGDLLLPGKLVDDMTRRTISNAPSISACLTLRTAGMNVNIGALFAPKGKADCGSRVSAASVSLGKLKLGVALSEKEERGTRLLSNVTDMRTYAKSTLTSKPYASRVMGKQTTSKYNAIGISFNTGSKNIGVALAVANYSSKEHKESERRIREENRPRAMTPQRRSTNDSILAARLSIH